MATNATTPQLKVVKALANALASRDLNNAEPILSKNFVAKIFPKVAKLPLELTKEEYLQKYGAVLPMFAQIEAVFNEVIEAPGKVVTHLTFLFTTVDGTTVDYDSIYIFSFVSEDGELKILDIKVFTDPEKRERFHAEVTKILANLGTPVA